MKIFSKLTTAAVALTCVLAAGCASYSIQPEAKAIAFPALLSTPIPVQVAIVQSRQSFSRDVGDQAEEFSRRLEQSGLFEAVYYPMRPTDQPGATMELSADVTIHVPDSTQIKDALNLGTFYLTSALFKLQYECLVDGTMILFKGTEVIKTYSARGKAVLTVKVDTTRKQELEVTQAPAWAMQAQLIEQLIQDREFLAQKLTGLP